MGSWSAHIEEEFAKIAEPISKAGFDVYQMLNRIYVKSSDGVLMEISIVSGMKTCDCGIYRYIPGRISTCPSCGADLA